MQLLILAFIVGIALLITKTNAGYAVKEVYFDYMNAEHSLDSIYQKWGSYYNLDWKLLKAIARQESSENPEAVNKNDPSVGLMQILCVGYDPQDLSKTCSNTFNIAGWPVTANQLLNPDINVQMGAQILKWNLDTYGWPKALAVYNNWGARTAPLEGPFPNQGYVDSVLNHYEMVKANG